MTQPASNTTSATPAEIDVRAIRLRTGLTQAAFAERFGIGAPSIRDWEQERTRPDQAARSYLLVIDREAEAVERALHARPNVE